jgi:phosphate transport system protein
MTIHFNREIEQLKKQILTLGAMVEETVQNAIMSLEETDTALALSIIKNDTIIDHKEVEVEEACLKILALHQPVATDLRYVVAVLKINNDLERVGDLAVNIAERAVALAAYKKIKAKIYFTEMVELVVKMLRHSLDALINLDPKLARQVCADDDEIDRKHGEMFDKIQKLIMENPGQAPYLIQYLSVSRYLERMADQTTNIAEDVIYMVEGEIARHNQNRLKLQNER